MPRADWREAVDASGKTYYVNDALRKTVWTLDGEDVSDASDSSEKGEPSSGGSTNAKSRSTSSGGGSSSSSSSSSGSTTTTASSTSSASSPASNATSAPSPPGSDAASPLAATGDTLPAPASSAFPVTLAHVENDLRRVELARLIASTQAQYDQVTAWLRAVESESRSIVELSARQERVAQVSVEACAARYAESLGRCQRLEAELDAAHEQRQRDSYAGKPAPWELPMTGNQYDHECLAHFRAQRQLKSEQEAALAAVMSQLEIVASKLVHRQTRG
ncbi:hypothetical protein DIPPA_00016 [Diplonema papillatum]|nr:hypothetical protein DIPPA_00016 [Diplonema papillatum]